MGALLCKHLRSEPFPNIYGEFIDRRKAGNQGHTGPGAQRSEIKLFPCALIWNCFYPMGNASSMLDWPIRLWSTTSGGSFFGEFVGSQKSLRERLRNKRSRSRLRAQITF